MQNSMFTFGCALKVISNVAFTKWEPPWDSSEAQRVFNKMHTQIIIRMLYQCERIDKQTHA